METLQVKPETVEQEIVIKFDLLTGQMSLTGCDKNPVVAWGMLQYAEARVRRMLMQADMIRDAQNASRISLPGGPLS